MEQSQTYAYSLSSILTQLDNIRNQLQSTCKHTSTQFKKIRDETDKIFFSYSMDMIG